MLKIFLTFFVFLFLVFNYNNIYNYYFLATWNFEEALDYKKNDINYYNMWVVFYNDKNYNEALSNFNMIEKKDYRAYFNLWNSYFYNSFYSDFTDDLILNLELSINSFSKSMELNTNDLVINNYNIALAELNKHKKESNSNNKKFDLWNWDNIGVIDKDWNKYNLNINDIIDEITEDEKNKYIEYINNLK